MKDLERFSRATAAIHEAAAAPDRWEAALRAVMDLLETDKGALVDVLVDPLALDGLLSIGHDPAVEKAYAEHYFAVDPARQVGMAMAPLEVIRSYELFDEALRAKHEYFDFARRSNIGDLLGVGTAVIAGRRHFLAVQRPADAPAFEDATRDLMRLIGPHLQRAREVEARLREAELARLELEAGIDHVATPAFIVDASRRTRHRNAAAAAFVVQFPGAFRRSAQLHLADPALDARLEAAIQRAARLGGESTVLLLPLRQGDSAELVVAPLLPRSGAGWERPLALVAILKTDVNPETVAWRLRQLYDLSPAEARVAAAIALGRTVEEVAAATGVKESTLRTQLRTVFQKTGSRKQADLARLALANAFRIRS